ncbi:hypothetical protein ACJ6WF_11560 [Streptomyces sp. MMS24-I2-30]|uniref:hypothetical protein n=1 Tax=Streptomyces sp. MMS24-I2-30 TaxID=3351564 RepID=UPI003896B58F
MTRKHQRARHAVHVHHSGRPSTDGGGAVQIPAEAATWPLLDAFLAERARAGISAEGLASALSDLQRGGVSVLFLDNHPESPRCLRGGMGRQVLARALVGTRAELVVVAEQELLDEGVGVLLRYAESQPRA